MKNRKWKILNRIACIFLAGVICSTAVFSSYSNTLQVYAADETPADKIKNIMHYVCNLLGFIPGASFITQVADLAISGSMDLLNYFIFNDDGTVTVTEAGVSAIQTEVENYIDDSDETVKINYIFLPTVSYNSLPDDYFYFGAVERPLYMKLFGNYDGPFRAPGKGSCINDYIAYIYDLNYYFDSDNYDFVYYLWGGGTYFYIVQGSFNGSYSIITTFHGMTYDVNTKQWNEVVSTNSMTGKFDTSLIATLNGRPILAFYSYEDALNYFLGKGSLWQGTSHYEGGNITVPVGALNYDYDGLYNRVKDLIDSQDNLTADDIRQIVDDAINNALDEINGTGGDSGGGEEEPDEDEKPASIEGWLEKIYKKLDDIYKQVKQIKWLSVADLIDDIVFNIAEIKNEFDPVVQTMMKKFPFSIPWDTALIFSLLADNPQAPHYEIPFVIESAGINETFEVDLERFEGLSKLSRGLLTLTFLMMLFALTRKIAQWFASNQK